MYYHPTKNEAQDVASKLLEEDDRVQDAFVQFEPGNGWVICIVPRRMKLDDLEDRFEIRDGKKRPPPVGKRPLAPAPIAPTGGKVSNSSNAPDGAMPLKGATARVWVIADQVGPDRKTIIDACVAEGINASTAATQYSKWKRAKGL